MHVYKCANCEKSFESEKAASRCPYCGSRVLIHEGGAPLKRKCGSCSGSCSGCHGCGR